MIEFKCFYVSADNSTETEIQPSTWNARFLDLILNPEMINMKLLIDLPFNKSCEFSVIVNYDSDLMIVSIPYFNYCFFTKSLIEKICNAHKMIRNGISSCIASSISIALEFVSQIVDKEYHCGDSSENFLYMDNNTIYINDLQMYIRLDGSSILPSGDLPF